MSDQPYHEGETSVQRRAGALEDARRNGRVISSRIPEGALGLVSQQRLAVAASLDERGRPWASALVGPPGFLSSPDPTRLDVDLSEPRAHPEDPLWRNLEADPRLGLLLLEPVSRRRLRVNGEVERRDDPSLRLRVIEAYPNCPKYIARRHPAPLPEPEAEPPPARRGTALEPEQRGWIEPADTLFVASAHPRGGADASHRGGEPGFVRFADVGTLVVPDYPGNSMFNTLGNFAADPRGSLLFLDFARHRSLQLVGRAELHWDGEGALASTGGTGRSWSFSVEGWVETEGPRRYAWELLDRSPVNPR